MHPHDGISLLVPVGRTAKHVHADYGFFKVTVAAREDVLDQVAKEGRTPIGARYQRASQKLCQLRPYEFRPQRLHRFRNVLYMNPTGNSLCLQACVCSMSEVAVG